MTVDLADLQRWVGRTERLQDRVTPVPLAALSATLDRDEREPVEGSPVPPLRHWLYFLPLYRRSEVGPDGHAKRGAFLPPVPLPRRMWAGGRLEFHRDLRVGESIERVSRIVRVDAKEGRAGALVFVVVRHEIAAGSELAIVEEHDIVYRDNPRPGEPSPPRQPSPGEPMWMQQIVPDEVLLFRYSALTFNGHRIHYDRRYVTEVEHYPGLIVHGPLLATLLIDLARDNVAPRALASFSFRAVMPLFDVMPFSVAGRLNAEGTMAQLWAQDADGRLAMEASATLR